MGDGKRKRSLERAMTAAGLLLRLVFAVFAVMIIVTLGNASYRFGYLVFREAPMEEEPGRDITVIIPENASVRETARILSVNGLIRDERVFLLQERLSNYHGKLLSGRFTLNTSMTPTEILAYLAGEPVKEDDS
ncbi:MAG: endolytic transglycosylase MltG [Lachnospiraceae bacterium]|nr:endolytic transglycosylase MltG [Lachnospiraceae bacterium]